MGPVDTSAHPTVREGRMLHLRAFVQTENPYETRHIWLSPEDLSISRRQFKRILPTCFTVTTMSTRQGPRRRTLPPITGRYEVLDYRRWKG